MMMMMIMMMMTSIQDLMTLSVCRKPSIQVFKHRSDLISINAD